ncbi:MAG: efflux RND transporter permease subunit [Vicinamibacterales bacterium]
MQWLAALCVKRPVFASVLILSLTVIGGFAFFRLGVDRFPKVDLPTILITTRLPGAAPEQVETEISDKVEEAVNTISGIDELRSTSSEGVSQVVVTFLLEKNVDVAAQEVRDKVNRVLPQLPTTAEQPTIEKMDPDAAPVLSVAVTAKKPVRDITEYADKVLRRRLESVNGVGQVVVVGGRPRQVNVVLDAERLRAHNLTVTDVSRALRGQNVEVPGGRVDQGAQALTLRLRGRIDAPDRFGDIVVRQVGLHPVLVRDVATIEDGMAEARTLASVDGVRTVLLQIRRQSGTNTVEVVHTVKERLAELQRSLPAGYELRIVRDQSQFIEASIHSVEEHLVLGSILAALVVVVFLWNLRSTAIAAIAIPTSIVATFGLIWYMGFTLNAMTMLALTLSVGIVIDDAIVVLENIFRFVEEKGIPPMQAAVAATKEIGLAVLATTLSLVAIFVPVAFMGGIVGRFMQSFGLTMAFAILVSLLVSFTLTPMMSARWLKAPARADGDHGAPHDSKHSGFFAVIDGGYARLLGWAMAHRALVTVGAVAVLLSSVPLFVVANKVFMPQDDQAEFEINVRAPEGTSLEATEIIANRIGAAVKRLPEVAYTLATVAGDGAATRNSANLYVRLKPIDERSRDQFAVMGEVRRDVLPPLATQGLRTSVQAVNPIGGSGTQAADIQLVLRGPDLAALEGFSARLVDEVKAMPGLVDVDTTLNAGKPELSVNVDRPKAADMGVAISDAAEALRLLVGGDEVTNYNEGGEQYEVHLRARAQDRETPDAIAGMTIPSSRLGSVALENVADFSRGSAPADISRVSRQRQVTIIANLLPGASQAEAQAQMLAKANALGMGSDFQAAFTGRSRELQRAAMNFVLAFVLSLVFMYLILAAQFESWLHPVTILLSLPLTLPFALLAIIIFRQSLNIFSALGLLVLFGVVKKNSILQIDHANQLKEEGLNARDAAVQASRDRLRPILMTTLAFVAGMIPLVVSSGIGSGTNRAIGFVIIGGQSMALLLTLVVTPVAYTMFDDLSQMRLFSRLLPWRRGVRRSLEQPATLLVLPLAFALSPLAARPVSAQSTRLALTVDEAVRMAEEHNTRLAADRLDPQISDARVEEASAAFKPSVTWNTQHTDQTDPPSSFLVSANGQVTQTLASNAGLQQRLPWLGTSYSMSWDASKARSTSFLNNFNPTLRSGLNMSVSQPLLRGLAIDPQRQQLEVSRQNRSVAGENYRERLVATRADVKRAYWDLVTARAAVDVQRASLETAQELARTNQARVDVGQSPPLDLVSAQAEVAGRQEALIVAETQSRQAEDRLRLLIFDPTDTSAWKTTLDPVDPPPAVRATPDVDAAVAAALKERSDLARARLAIETASTNTKFAGNQRLPDVRVNANYAAAGLGGSRLLRVGGFPGTVVGTSGEIDLGSVLDQVVSRDFPTWTAGVSVSYPVGRSAQDAALARARLELAQAQQRLKTSEGEVIRQVRDAALQVEMQARRIETSRAARELAEQRLDAERKRFDVGMSTSFLVIQAQRDLAQAKTNELAATLAYDVALVNFEAVQQVPR